MMPRGAEGTSREESDQLRRRRWSLMTTNPRGKLINQPEINNFDAMDLYTGADGIWSSVLYESLSDLYIFKNCPFYTECLYCLSAHNRGVGKKVLESFTLDHKINSISKFV